MGIRDSDRKWTVLYPLGMLVALVFCVLGCYSTLYWGWVTATPLAPEQLARARYNAYAWFAVSVGSLVALIALPFVWMRSWRNADARNIENVRADEPRPGIETRIQNWS